MNQKLITIPDRNGLPKKSRIIFAKDFSTAGSGKHDGKIKVGRVDAKEERKLANAFRSSGIPIVVVVKTIRLCIHLPLQTDGTNRSILKIKNKTEVTVMEMKFYRCAHCGQIVAIVKGTGAPVICCGEKMQEIVPGTTDAVVEKHVPVYEVKDNRVFVTIGSVPHPMLPEHYIEWVSLQTKFGNQRKALNPGQEPKVCFSICEGDKVEAVYAYCNLHSLWKA